MTNIPILHWSDKGVASWYDFAIAIGELGVRHGIIACEALVEPISSIDFPVRAKRPGYSALNIFDSARELNLTPVCWRKALSEVLLMLKKNHEIH